MILVLPNHGELCMPDIQSRGTQSAAEHERGQPGLTESQLAAVVEAAYILEAVRK